MNKTYKEIIEEKGFVVVAPVGISMLPIIREGIDTVKLVKPVNLKKYDVILYQRIDGKYILHRIVGIKKKGYILCGDSQIYKEKYITDDMIIGVVEGIYREENYISVTDPKYIKYYKKIVRSLPIRKIKYYFNKLRKYILKNKNDN